MRNQDITNASTAANMSPNKLDCCDCSAHVIVASREAPNELPIQCNVRSYTMPTVSSLLLNPCFLLCAHFFPANFPVGWILINIYIIANLTSKEETARRDA